MPPSRVVTLATILAMTLLSVVGRANEGPSPYAAWSFGAFGANVGAAGIVVAEADGHSEIYLDATPGPRSSAHYWYSVRFVPKKLEYEQSFMS